MAKTKTMIQGANAEKVQCVGTWEEFVQYDQAITRQHTRWVFRGLSKARHKLQPSLERSYEGWNLKDTKQDVEDGMLRRFKRNAYRYLDSPPEKNDSLEWLAVMQHYGAPTRLLDWSYSVYVAGFFALESAGAFDKHEKRSAENQPCAVWAIPHEELADAARTEMPPKLLVTANADGGLDKASTSNQILGCKKRFVISLTPIRLNERLSVQQGTFLAPSNLSFSFLENLSAMRKLKSGIHRIELEFDQDEIQTALGRLRKMNVNRTSLFPGIDGFAQDMKIFGFDPSYRALGGSVQRRKKQIS